MSNDTTDKVLRLVTDESGLPHLIALGAISGAENVNDAGRYLESAARALLSDGGNAAATLAQALAGEPDAVSRQELLSSVNWTYIAKVLVERYGDDA